MGAGVPAGTNAPHQLWDTKSGTPASIMVGSSGASGSLGTELCAKAPADGYTLVLGSIAGFAINPHLLKHVGYHPVKDFTAAAALGQAPPARAPSSGKLPQTKTPIDRQQPKHSTAKVVES